MHITRKITLIISCAGKEGDERLMMAMNKGRDRKFDDVQPKLTTAYTGLLKTFKTENSCCHSKTISLGARLCHLSDKSKYKKWKMTT